jgi:hypothetical protein
MEAIIGDARRIERNTAEHVNRELHEEARGRVERYRSAPAAAIDARLAELEREWDIERALEAFSAMMTLGGMALAWGRRDFRWLLLPIGVQSFFIQHAVQGWCPPLPMLRRLGFRTVREIDAERRALLAARG